MIITLFEYIFVSLSETPGPTPPPLVTIGPLPTAERSVVLKGNCFFIFHLDLWLLLMNLTANSRDGCLLGSKVMTLFLNKPIFQLCLRLKSFHAGESHTEKIELLNPVNLTLECTWAGDQNKPPNITGLWRKDGEEIENSRLTVQLENEQYNLKRA